MRRSLQSMLIKNLNALYAMNQCVKSIHRSRSYLSLVDSIPQTTDKTRTLSRTYANVLGRFGTLSARSHQGFNSRLKGVARELAVVIGISLSMAVMPRLEASVVPIKAVKELANYQLTDVQYKCHNDIVYRESRWKIDAVNGSHHGLYQGRSKSLKNAPGDYQFWWYWYYVSNRYGITQYDEPNYCKALHHLKTKGWQ